MSLQAITIDFWNTMVVARTNGARRQERRTAFLKAVLADQGRRATDDEINHAFKRVIHQSETTWRTRHTTPTTDDIVRALWVELGVHADAVPHEDTVRLFQEGILEDPPALLEGLPEALAWAHGTYRLGVISDTMFSPGRVIRRLLDRYGVLQYFDAFVFSDEEGYSKPDSRAFERAAHLLGTTPAQMAHIGDLRRTDIAGARNAGARAILFTGVHEDADPGGDPDLILNHWDHLPSLF